MKDAPRLRLASVLGVILIFAAVAAFQLAHRADRSNLTAHPDEAAHFVSGVCLLDYCRTAFGTNPRAFAESYYVRYPKVAFGHWPPLFYAVQALWYAVFGVSTLSALLLMGGVTAAAGSIFFVRIKRLHGLWIATLSTAALLSLKTVCMSELTLMSDMLAALFMMLSVFAFCDGWSQGAPRYWMQSAFWALLAIMTKESALSLLAFGPAALLLAGRSFMTRQKLLRVGAGLALLGAATFFLYRAAGVSQLRGSSASTARGIEDQWQRLALLGPFFAGASPALFLIAGAGAAALFAKPLAGERGSDRSRDSEGAVGSRDQRIHNKAGLLWLSVVAASQLVAREGVEARYFLPAYFPAALLFAQGLASIEWLGGLLTGRRMVGIFAMLGCALFAIASSHRFALPEQRTGYAEIAAAIPFGARMPAILVSSDARGEGAMVAERLMQDPSRTGLVLRASKMLARSDWMGGNYSLITQSEADVLAFLDSVPVHYIVVDMEGFIEPDTRNHHRLLEETIRHHSARFRMLGDFPLYFGGHRRESAVQVYEYAGATPRPDDVIRIDMTSSLGKILELPVKAASPAAISPRSSVDALPQWLQRLLPRYPEGPVSLRLEPGDESINPTGGWGRIYVTAASGSWWQARRIPAWIQIHPSPAGEGNALLTYEASENDSWENRRAMIPVGDQVVQVRQARFLDLPPAEPAADLPVPPPPAGFSYLPKASRWHLENFPGVTSTLLLAQEGPDGSDSLVLNRPEPPDAARVATVVYFPGIEIREGERYGLTLWLKADHPALIWARFGQKTSPYNPCGLDQPIDTTPTWREVSVSFRARGEGCAVNENRLSIEAGNTTGKLWLTRVSLHREPL